MNTFLALHVPFILFGIYGYIIPFLSQQLVISLPEWYLDSIDKVNDYTDKSKFKWSFVALSGYSCFWAYFACGGLALGFVASIFM